MGKRACLSVALSLLLLIFACSGDITQALENRQSGSKRTKVQSSVPAFLDESQAECYRRVLLSQARDGQLGILRSYIFQLVVLGDYAQARIDFNGKLLNMDEVDASSVELNESQEAWVLLEEEVRNLLDLACQEFYYLTLTNLEKDESFLMELEHNKIR